MLYVLKYIGGNTGLFTVTVIKGKSNSCQTALNKSMTVFGFGWFTKSNQKV